VRKNYLRIGQAFLIALLLVSIAPISLIVRNQTAVGMSVISTNLGTTMNIGVGETRGGYKKLVNGIALVNTGVKCDTHGMNAATVDQQIIHCVLIWYSNNPDKIFNLFLSKSALFWAPWFGPNIFSDSVNGTMARNPWLTIHPFKNITKTQDGINLLYGGFGKLISWLWLIGGILFLIFGFWTLYKERREIRLIATIALSIVVCSWLVTLISIGDHRFRLPIMTASLFLQAVGIKTLFARGKSQIVAPLK
jgi:hypothetical protein